MDDSYDLLRKKISGFQDYPGTTDMISYSWCEDIAILSDRLLKALIKADAKIEELRGEIDEFRHDHGYEKREWETEL